jgi:hypothetical protein
VFCARTLAKKSSNSSYAADAGIAPVWPDLLPGISFKFKRKKTKTQC